MIVISRRKDEGVVIGDNIVVRILDVMEDTVELCIEMLDESGNVVESTPAFAHAGGAAFPIRVTIQPNPGQRSWESEFKLASQHN